MSDIDHTRDCILPSDGRAEGLVRASELFALAAERDALRAENERLRQVLENNQQARVLQGKAITDASNEIEHLRAENERLRAALEGIADLPPGYADMRQDDLVVILANKARAVLEGKL